MNLPRSAAVPGKIFVIHPTLPSPAVRLRQSAETMAAAVLAAAADPAVPARTSALRAMHMLLLLVQRALQSAAVPAAETASPLRTMPLLMLTVLGVPPLVMAVCTAGMALLQPLRSPGMPPYMQKPVKLAAPSVPVSTAIPGISRSILKKMPTLPPSVPMTVPRLEIVTVRTVQQPSTLPAAP